jgi:hypothetical protein
MSFQLLLLAARHRPYLSPALFYIDFTSWDLGSPGTTVLQNLSDYRIAFVYGVASRGLLIHIESDNARQ